MDDEHSSIEIASAIGQAQEIEKYAITERYQYIRSPEINVALAPRAQNRQQKLRPRGHPIIQRQIHSIITKTAERGPTSGQWEWDRWDGKHDEQHDEHNDKPTHDDDQDDERADEHAD